MNARRIPPPEKFGVAASRILVGVPARQPELVPASRKSDGGAAEGSSLTTAQPNVTYQHPAVRVKNARPIKRQQKG